MIERVKVFDSQEEAEKEIPIHTAVKVRIGEKSICLARSSQGYHAVSDTCPHLGASLSGGNINRWNEVVCPWHSYKFNLKTGDETTGYGYRVKRYPVEISDDGIFICI
ncbi:MAG: Rieske (2Fe-2S) protein [Cytophagales bacterium]|nr:Rieske (2Fe-2S) protein [Cytophagales bacterium]